MKAADQGLSTAAARRKDVRTAARTFESGSMGAPDIAVQASLESPTPVSCNAKRSDTDVPLLILILRASAS